VCRTRHSWEGRRYYHCFDSYFDPISPRISQRLPEFPPSHCSWSNCCPLPGLWQRIDTQRGASSDFHCQMLVSLDLMSTMLQTDEPCGFPLATDVYGKSASFVVMMRWAAARRPGSDDRATLGCPRLSQNGLWRVRRNA
jgi:hypothetical protein